VVLLCSVDPERGSAYPGGVALLRGTDVLVRPLAIGTEAGVDGHELVAGVLQERDGVRKDLGRGSVDGLVAEDEMGLRVRFGDLGEGILAVRNAEPGSISSVIRPDERL
jgi:hypothetical protein